jgi:DNA adenine methylase
LLSVLERFFPARIEQYAEPFAGSAAVFFHLRARGALVGRVTLADVNVELINVYRVVRDNVEELLSELAVHKVRHNREHYYETRSKQFQAGVGGAARTIYLNKTCFNGLYRVNRRGQFNVPMGRYVNPGIFDPALLRAASAALQGVELRCQDFHATIDNTSGGVLYVDPPYVPLSPTSSFTGYAAGGFGIPEQEALAVCLVAAGERGVRFVLSNSFTPLVRSLYERFEANTYRVPAKRAINSNGSRRGPIDEAVILNFRAVKPFLELELDGT